MTTRTARKSATKKTAAAPTNRRRAPAKSTATKTAPAKKAAAGKPSAPEPEAVAEPVVEPGIVWLPGKRARVLPGGERTEGVPPSVEGTLEALEDFLEPRFKWQYTDNQEGVCVLYAATHDVLVGNPETAEDAAVRATHVGSGATYEAAVRNLCVQIIGMERPLQITFAKKPAPRAPREPDPGETLVDPPQPGEFE